MGREYAKRPTGLSVVNPFDLVEGGSDDEFIVGDILPPTVMTSLRKCAKKDQVTRLKGVEELVRYMESNPAEPPSSQFSGHFLRIFTKLSIDPERRIREAVFALLAKLISVDKKIVAPIIKDLVFYWTGAFYDPVTSIAAAASKSFDSCFINEKQVTLALHTAEKVFTLVKEFIEFRAEEHRLALLADAEGNAELGYGLAVSRALASLAWLAKMKIPIPEEYLTLVESRYILTPGNQKHDSIITANLYLLSCTVNLSPEATLALLKMALKDQKNPLRVLEFLDKRVDLVVGEVALVTLFTKSFISQQPRPLIAKLTQFIGKLPGKKDILLECLSPTTLDTLRLQWLISDFYGPLAKGDDFIMDTLFETFVSRAASPWNNADRLEVVKAFESIVTSEQLHDYLVPAIPNVTSVGVLLYAFEKGYVEDNSALDALSRCKVSRSDVYAVLGSKLGEIEAVREMLFPRFSEALPSDPKLSQYLHLFDLERVMDNVPESGISVILKAVLADPAAFHSVPWLRLHEACGTDPDLNDRLCQAILSHSQYSHELYHRIIASFHGPLPASINQTWLENGNFASDHLYELMDKLALSDVKGMHVEQQVQVIRNASEPGAFIELVNWAALETYVFALGRPVELRRHHLYFNLHGHFDAKVPCEMDILEALVERVELSEQQALTAAITLFAHDRPLFTRPLSVVPLDTLIGKSELHGGYYSALLARDDRFKVVTQPVHLDKSSDHTIICTRVFAKTHPVEFLQTWKELPDKTLLGAVLVPILKKLLNLSMEDIEGLVGSIDDTFVMAGLLTVLADMDVIDDFWASKSSLIAKLCSNELPCMLGFLSRKPQFIDDSLAERLETAWFGLDNQMDMKLLSRCIRQIAPFRQQKYDLERVCGMLASENCPSVKLAARFIFNLRQDELIERARVELEADRSFKGSVTTLPNTLLDWDTNGLYKIEAFVGLAEGAKEVPIVLAALSTVFKESLDITVLSEFLSVLGWINMESEQDSPTKPVNLQSREFTTVDWDDPTVDDITLHANLLFRAWRLFPAVMRGKFEELAASSILPDRRAEHLMSDYISPMILHREFERCRRFIKSPEAAGGNLKLRLLLSSTQSIIQAEYRFEEASLVLMLAVPASFPLKPVSMMAEGAQRHGLPESKWKAAVLSCQALLSTTCSPVDGLRAWQANLDRQLAGQEPCTVCYSVLHAADRTLPTPQCRTCQNRFHAACLYKWFRSSGQATCPLCRSMF